MTSVCYCHPVTPNLIGSLRQADLHVRCTNSIEISFQKIKAKYSFVKKKAENPKKTRARPVQKIRKIEEKKKVPLPLC